MRRCWIAGWFALGLGVAAGWAEPLYVDDNGAADPGPGDPLLSDPLEDGSLAHPFDALQEALDAALPGTEVLVADGLYTGVGNRDLDFRGKALTLRSVSGDPALCIIDCGQAGRGFTFRSGESRATVIQGLTIRTAFHAASGGGLYCVQSGPTVRDCIITNCRAGAYGGALYSTGNLSRPLLINCTLSNNTANAGGGIYCADGSWASLDGCTLADNVAPYGGGGYCRDVSRVNLTNCTLVRNRGTLGGALLCQISASPTLRNCLLGGNRASRWGAGVMCATGSSPWLINCALVGNVAGDDGGGVYARDGSNPVLVGCTLTENVSDLGGALSCAGESYVRVKNSIIWFNLPSAFNIVSGVLDVSYSDVFGGVAGVGNIDDDPLFIDPPGPGPDGAWGTLDDVYGDLRLSAGTRCIDAGDNVDPPRDELDVDGDDCTTEPLPVDLAGAARYVDDPDTDDLGRGAAPLVDMGAYEFGATAEPPATPCTGDVNCDGAVDESDVTPFVLALCNPPLHATLFPGCALQTADLNNDGVLDFADINPFVAVLSQR